MLLTFLFAFGYSKETLGIGELRVFLHFSAVCKPDIEVKVGPTSISQVFPGENSNVFVKYGFDLIDEESVRLRPLL